MAGQNQFTHKENKTKGSERIHTPTKKACFIFKRPLWPLSQFWQLTSALRQLLLINENPVCYKQICENFQTILFSATGYINGVAMVG